MTGTTKSTQSQVASTQTLDEASFRSFEDAVRVISDLANQISSSTSFESAQIARQMAQYASALRSLRNSIVHGQPAPSVSSSTSGKSNR